MLIMLMIGFHGRTYIIVLQEVPGCTCILGKDSGRRFNPLQAPGGGLGSVAADHHAGVLGEAHADPAAVVIDAVVRLLPGTLGGQGAADSESFGGGMLEYPQYTRPASFRGREVPEIEITVILYMIAVFVEGVSRKVKPKILLFVGKLLQGGPGIAGLHRLAGAVVAPHPERAGGDVAVAPGDLGGGGEREHDVLLALQCDRNPRGVALGGGVHEHPGAGGQGQVILRDPDSGVLWGGSDPRADGCAMSLV